jgi:hypothetical protein
MTILSKLATSLNRRDEVPNQLLAKQIVRTKNKAAVKELVTHLSDKKDIANDCIKVLYEAGEQEPSLIAPYAKEFIALLDHKNNRLQWGAMTALHACTLENPKTVFAAVPKIKEAADKGTVITNDQCVKILAKLCTVKQYYGRCFELLNEMVLKSPINQLPSYAETALSVVSEKDKSVLLRTIAIRLPGVEQEPKIKRLEKVIRQLTSERRKP